MQKYNCGDRWTPESILVIAAKYFISKHYYYMKYIRPLKLLCHLFFYCLKCWLNYPNFKKHIKLSLNINQINLNCICLSSYVCCNSYVLLYILSYNIIKCVFIQRWNSLLWQWSYMNCWNFTTWYTERLCEYTKSSPMTLCVTMISNKDKVTLCCACYPTMKSAGLWTYMVDML